MSTSNPGGTLPRLARLPLMHCRHAVGNYVGLFEALFEVIYEAGEVDGPVVVQPDGTLGDALDLDEQKVAEALAAPPEQGRPESVLLGIVRTILEDQGTPPEAIEWTVDMLADVLRDRNLPTFADKADLIETRLDIVAGSDIGPTRAQADEVLAAFRGIGKLVADLVGLVFPRLVDWRIELGDDPKRWVELTGYYTVLLPSSAEDLLTASFANDRLTLELHVDTVRLSGSATARFFREDPRGRNEGERQERHELAMTLAENALGTFELHDLTLSFRLDDRLERAATEPFAPRHEMRLADWARPSLSVSVESADIVIYPTWLSSLAGLLAWAFLGIDDLERELEDLVVAHINGQDDLGQIGDDPRRYVEPVAERLMPRAFVAETARYRDPFVQLRTFDRDEVAGAGGRRALGGLSTTRWEPEIELEFDELATVSERGGVAVRNLPPDPIEVEGRPIDAADHLPDNFDELDPPGGEWAWPSVRPGELVRLDLSDAEHRQHALEALASTAGLTTRARTMAALSVEGLDARRIGTLRHDAVDVRGGTVLGRRVSPQTLAWLGQTMRESAGNGHVFRTLDHPAGAALADAELRHVQQAMLLQVGLGRTPEPGGPLVRPFDAAIWTMDHQPRSPLPATGGSRRDPGWYGLSTNCVAATTLYRSLREGGELERSGTTRSRGRRIAWRVEGCTDVAADFSGRAPGRAPALAVAQIAVGIGPDLDNLTRWTADVRLRLKPRFHGSGCLSDAAVQPVLEELACVEALTGGEVPETTRLRQLEFRGFMVLGADLTDRTRDIELVSLRNAVGVEPPSTDPARIELRDALAAWLAELPEVPVLYNPFRSIPGASDRGFSASGGWLCLERRYRFPDLAGLRFG